MILHTAIAAAQLRSLIRRKEIQGAGNRVLKIYGTLSCRSGKRMQPKNRVFFSDAAEALAMGYRPCGHCMHKAYQQWKQQKQDEFI